MTTYVQKRDLVSILDLSKEEIEQILSLSTEIKNGCTPDLCKGDILASCFFEPSTRSRLSFESAMHRLGGSVIGFSDSATTSTAKGETLYDTMRIISSYADILVFRHPQDGAARVAADASDKPLINAGDGANQHPTQTLIDLFTIRHLFDTIDGLHIAIAGDLKYARTVHSLVKALSLYSVRLYFISPEMLQLPDQNANELRKKGLKFSFHECLTEILPKVDLLYMTRIQKERFLPLMPLTAPMVFSRAHLTKVKSGFRILHPLPRKDELDPSIDDCAFFDC